MIELALLKKHYSTILQLMPEDYEKSLGMLQNYLTDDQICAVLGSSNFVSANKMILDCLITRINNGTDLLDFCDQLQAITSEHKMNSLINVMRHGEFLRNKNVVACGLYYIARYRTECLSIAKRFSK